MNTPNGTDGKEPNLSAINIAASSLRQKIDAETTISLAIKAAVTADIAKLQATHAVVTAPVAKAKQWRVIEIEIKGCRGIVDGPHLRFGKKGVLLFGDNGTGKSSYVDGLEYTLTGLCSSLDKGDQGVSWKKNGVHIKSANTQIKITLTDGTSEATAVLDKEGNVTAHEDLRAFILAAKDRPFILRRWQLLRFIFAKPAERYEAIASFLSLGDYNRLEQKLKDDLRQALIKVRADNLEISGIEQNLRKLLGIRPEVVVNNETYLAGINAIIAKTGDPPILQISELLGVLVEAEKKLRGIGGKEALLTMQQLQKTEASLIDLAGKGAPESLRTYLFVRSRLIIEEAKMKGHFYGEALQQASLWIAQDKLQSCPVCEQEIKPESVVASIKAKMQLRKTLTTLQQEQREKQKEFIERVTAWRDVLTACRNLGVEEINQSTVDSLIAMIARHSVFTEESVLKADEVALDTLQLEQQRTLALESIQKKQKAMFDSQAMTVLSQMWQALTVAKDSMSNLTAARDAVERSKKKEQEIGTVIKLAEDARKDAVNTILKEITSLANSYFDAIHPDENLGDLKIFTRESQGASLAITSKFHGKDAEDPRAYYSESHLDTLGLCIFLALRRRHFEQANEMPILVLDDVVHSVDGPHRQRIAELLFKEFSDHQLFITTHEPYWFNYLKQKTGGNLEICRIAEWTIDKGPSWGDHESDMEWLQNPANTTALPADRVVHAGRALEQILQHLCDHLEIAVPLRMDGNYTIEPLWNSFHSKRKKNEEFYSAAESHLNEIEALRSLRNWSVHWKQWGELLSADEARRFVDAVTGLYRCSYCGVCHDFIRKIKQLNGVWSCKNQCINYTEGTAPGVSIE
jgi:hypothetical protein